MKSIEVVMERLGVDRDSAVDVLNNASEYVNKGKGLVFVDYKTADRVAALFDEKPLWLNSELNEKVGWQFSQAIFWLRKTGWKIKTVSLGGRMFAYKLISKPVGEE